MMNGGSRHGLLIASSSSSYMVGLLVMAGPWDDDSGAVLVFRTDEAGVREIMDGDPYYSVPGVTVVSLRGWKPIVGDLIS